MRTNKEPEETPVERPHYMNDKINEKIEKIIKRNNIYEIALIQVKYLIQKSLDPNQTSEMSDSLDCLYKALDICQNTLGNINKENIKKRIKQYIQNIEDFHSKYITYKADGIKELFEDILEVLKN